MAATDHDTRLLVPITDVQTMLGGLGRTTVYHLANAGDLTRVHIGARSFITRASIDAFIARQIDASNGTDAA